MWRFILITFGFLGFAFYELSGGADYAPSDNSLQAHMQRNSDASKLAQNAAEQPPQTPAVTSDTASPEVTLATVKAETPDADRAQEEAIELALNEALEAEKGTPPATLTDASFREPGSATMQQTVIGLGELTGRTDSDERVSLTLASANSADPSGMGALGQGFEFVQVASADSRNAAARTENATETGAETATADGYVVLSTDQAPDMREVTGNVVNMRSGPGTKYGRLDQLKRGAPVEVLEDMGNGWLRLRVEDTGRVGYMAARLVSDAG
ncbi:SH3 domain-containing protein [Roseovarius sp. C7]|uniref:SH3 domain-containing protein n=1 Tax=Roseovarius sp. C7 TaxID=3398643 RepID=UPI0039F7393F